MAPKIFPGATPPDPPISFLVALPKLQAWIHPWPISGLLAKIQDSVIAQVLIWTQFIKEEEGFESGSFVGKILYILYIYLVKKIMRQNDFKH